MGDFDRRRRHLDLYGCEGYRRGKGETARKATGAMRSLPRAASITRAIGQCDFTLADGTQLVIPRANTLTVGFDSYEPFTVYAKGSDVAIVLPQGLKESDYTAMVAGEEQCRYGHGYQTRAASPWQVDLTKPAFVDGVYQNNAKVRVTPVDAANGDKAILKVTLIDKEGQEVSVSRVLQYYENALTFAAMEGGSFTLEEDLVLKEPVIVPAGKTLDLDLGGHTIAFGRHLGR